jgi:hypothetical protein
MNATRCITLVSCRRQEVVHYFTANITDADNIVNLVGLGNIVQINDPLHFAEQYYTLTYSCDSFNIDPQCYECTTDPNRIDDPTGNLLTFWSTTPYGDVCPNLERAYVLVNCRSGFTFNEPEDINPTPETALVTTADFTAYVGMVVHIAEYPDICFSVLGPYTEDTGCPCDEYTVVTAFPDCECCYPAENVNEIECCDIPKYTQKPFKKFYHIVDSDCDIRDNQKFGNSYYKLFNQIKNGIQNCCDNIDFEKLWIRKELSDYSKINPPDQCVVIIPATVVPCEGPDPLIPSCDPPENIIAEGSYD